MLTDGAVLQNRYKILCLLGQGGMGAVYLAQDLHLGRTVAVKQNINSDPRQFLQEALILANLKHPNLPGVTDHFIEQNSAQYLVMEFVDGEDLGSRLQREGALPEAQVLTWFDQILDAVAYMHDRGVIHRDIKPTNIKITSTGEAILVDFGIAKVDLAGQVTMSGAKAATPGFASPEQYRGGTDQRSDIYSLGATLYALLTGGEPPDARVLVVGSAKLVSPRSLNRSLSSRTEQVITRAMDLVPEKRFQNVGEMRRALGMKDGAVVATRPSSNRTGIFAVVTIALIALFGIWYVQSVSSPKSIPISAIAPTMSAQITPLRTAPPPTLIPSPKAIATATYSPTETSLPKATATPTPVPNTKPGTVLPFGEPWYKDGLIAVIKQGSLDRDSVSIELTFQNNTNHPITFHWEDDSNGGTNVVVSDNLGNVYSHGGGYQERSPMFQPGQSQQLFYFNYPVPISRKEITQVKVVLTGMSSIDRATWILPIYH